MKFSMSGKIKNISFALMGIGLVTIIYSFFSDPQRAWSSLLVNNFYFLAIGLAAAFFVAVQYVSNAGWSTALQRIPEAMGTYVPIAGLGMLLIFLLGKHDIYHWTHHDLFDVNSPHYDPIIAGKKAYLNTPFFLFRMVIVLAAWSVLFYFIRKNSIKSDVLPQGDYSRYKKNFTLSAVFIVVFAVTSSTASWDWLMSIDPHWFSTLFGWYVFSGMFISALVVITLITLYLKKQGYLQNINDSHIHDLGKYVFAFSIFWTYLWISQFLLIWYSNIPEEVVYFNMRMDHFQTLFLGSFVVNFVLPTLILMTRNSKRRIPILAGVGVVLFIGHWLDIYLMVIPGVLGGHAYIGIPEIGMLLGFLGLFTFVVFRALGKAELVKRNHPYIEESLEHHI